jgi:hypothetical protein
MTLNLDLARNSLSLVNQRDYMLEHMAGGVVCLGESSRQVLWCSTHGAFVDALADLIRSRAICALDVPLAEGRHPYCLPDSRCEPELN